MSKYLSQDDVDNLISAFTTGDIELEESNAEDNLGVRAFDYDFKRPNRFSKDQLRTLHSVHDSFARIYASSLAGILRTFIEIQIESIDQVTYSEVIMSIPNPTAVYVFDVMPVKRQAFMEINLPLVFSIIDRIFGGKGKTYDRTRELTLIEESILHRIVDRAFQDLKTAWKPFYEMDILLKNIETNPRFVQISFQNDIVLFISFKVLLEQSYGLISLCFPYLLLEPMIEKLTSQNWFSTGTKEIDKFSVEIIRDNLEKSFLDLIVELGKTNITVEDLLNLEVGDVIKLDNDIKQDLLINIGDNSKFLGRPGLSGKKRAVKITRELESQ